MKTVSTWIGALLAALMLTIVPATAQYDAPACRWTLDSVAADIERNDGEIVAIVPVAGETFTHLLIARVRGNVVMSLVAGPCVLTPPVSLGAAARITEA